MTAMTAMTVPASRPAATSRRSARSAHPALPLAALVIVAAGPAVAAPAAKRPEKAAATPAAPARPPTADELLRKYDAIMGAESFEAVMRMEAHRDDGSVRTYKLRILKSGKDKLRVWFDEPASVRGQEMLRQGDNLWVYMPNLKRAVRLASRESFQGGDFNNADVLRVNYQADYTATLAAQSELPDAWQLELKARGSDAAYDHVKLWLRKSDGQPVRGQYFTASGKMLREAELTDVKTYAGGFARPSRFVMKNKLAEKRRSVMTVESMDVRVKPAATRFVLDDLGR
jgi:outer membrane lipoprotein-sorting protein